ncbi:FecR domain-containing protein [Pedobacter nyackensis]|uniref:FecR domain-containing protein n=1 Tax=Pedobacter nyackensis TaxID=475255 RepID=UPI0029314030|nr:FecR domain-containing protein [Pedobacter nyackensis]
MGTKKTSFLYNKFQRDSLTVAELEEFKALVSKPEFESEFCFMFENRWKNLRSDELLAMPEEIERQQFNYITSAPPQNQEHARLRIVTMVAAAILIILAVGLLFYSTGSKRSKKVDMDALANKIAPGKNTATLTLANGKTITLSEVKNGVVIQPSKLTYNDGTEVSGDTENFHGPQMITTPRGGIYTVILPDGSQVMLNAASTLKYPSSFSGNKMRQVELTGEAYFKVSKDKQRPFVVVSKDQEISVLGTHFNVNAYLDDTVIKTTLVEGAVAINDETFLKPGQQSIFKQGVAKVVMADVEMETAWKNGQFIFDGQNFKTMINNISRWYNVDISYDPALENLHFGGRISRSRTLGGILKMLEGTGDIKFKIEGRRISMTR